MRRQTRRSRSPLKVLDKGRTRISLEDADRRNGFRAPPEISLGQTGRLPCSDLLDRRGEACVLCDQSPLMESRLRGPGWPTSLLGRTDECALLDGLIGAIRRNESRSLVLRGEAGIGKTALLECLVESASDLTVVRAV